MGAGVYSNLRRAVNAVSMRGNVTSDLANVQVRHARIHLLTRAFPVLQDRYTSAWYNNNSRVLLIGRRPIALKIAVVSNSSCLIFRRLYLAAIDALTHNDEH